MLIGVGRLGRVANRVKQLPLGSSVLRSFGAAAAAFVGSFTAVVFTSNGAATASFVGGGGGGAYQLSLYDLSDFRNLMVL